MRRIGVSLGACGDGDDDDAPIAIFGAAEYLPAEADESGHPVAMFAAGEAAA
ncbi:MAG: hypothetical protein ACRDV7_03445 [Acidimicrobiia bacterium]